MKYVAFAVAVGSAVGPVSGLAQEVYDIDDIVVSAGEAKVASETPQSVSVVDQEELDAAQPTTIGDALTDLPGVKAIGSDRVLGEGFNIRGFGSDLAGGENRLIVQVDGATKFFQQYRMGSLFTDPELYKRVEVLRGPASSTLYGSGALAGVVTLETKDASDFLEEGDNFAVRQKLEYTSNGQGGLSSTVLAFRPTSNFELLGALVYRANDDFEDGDGVEVPGSAFQAPSGLVKARLRFGESSEHSVFASYQHWTTQEDGARYEQTSTGSDVFGLIDREVTDQTATVGYTYTPLDNPWIDFSATYSYSNTKNVQENATALIPSVLFEDSTYYYRTHQLKLENTSSIAFAGMSEGYLTFGAQVSQQTRFAEAESGEVGFQPGGKDTKIAGYVQGEFTFGDRFTIIPGVRIEHATLEPDDLNSVFSESVSNTAISPKLAALFEVTDNINVFGSIAYTERLPVLDELYDTGSGSIALEPEQSINYELGASFTANDMLQRGDALTVKGTLFHNNVDNLIDRASTATPYENIGEARIQGFELEGAYQSERFFGNLAYTIIRGDDLTTDEPMTSIPADEVVLALGTRLPAYNLEFGWQGTFAWEQDRLPTGDDPTPGYGINDVYLAWRPDTGVLAGAEMRFGVDNIFDKAYQEHLSGDPAKGRTYKVTLSKTF
ncbi:TonB-dependent receptor domain-containing protein [Algicella marina]|uniref:TonB-dependent receptor domain-containing protein n=1 Tax=Algicella marina TaxID=2683284 RepID=UPI00137A137A|nr:TonB-dependent receptor [Algicella marina]